MCKEKYDGEQESARSRRLGKTGRALKCSLKKYTEEEERGRDVYAADRRLMMKAPRCSCPKYILIFVLSLVFLTQISLVPTELMTQLIFVFSLDSR